MFPAFDPSSRLDWKALKKQAAASMRKNSERAADDPASAVLVGRRHNTFP